MQLLRFSVEFSVFLYLCVVLLSHQTLFHCADSKISRWTERERERNEGGGWCVFLSILSGSGRSRGEGRFGRNAGGKALFSPHPALLFCLLFSVFYSSVLRLGASAPVCFMFARRGKRFVCFHDCQQTSGWKCLTTVRPFCTRKPALISNRKSPLPSQPRGKGVKWRRACETWQKSSAFHKDGGSIHVAADRSEGWRRPQPLHCVNFTPSEERDLFRLACSACWEILECVEWGTVVLLHLSGCTEQMKPNMSAELLGAAFHVWIKVERISANEITASVFD